MNDADVYPLFCFVFYQCYLITGRARGPADGSVVFLGATVMALVPFPHI